MPNLPRSDLIRLAGQCVRCSHYDLEKAEFAPDCYSCSRYHADLFEERACPACGSADDVTCEGCRKGR